MLKFEQVQNYKHSIKILLRRKNLWFLRRTNHYTNTLGNIRKRIRKIIQQKEEILAKRDELQIINSEKDKFFNIIAHDLKSPFNSIKGFSEILAEQVEKKNYDKIKEYSGIILKSSESAVELLKNLMEWAQSQTGRMNYNPVTIDVSNLIDEIILLLNDSAWQKSITIKRSLAPNSMVFADKAMMSTVLRNLISNAIKFTRSGGEIIISARLIQNEIKVSFSDNGVGISKANTQKLFRIEGNYSTPGTNNESGTGLGLILCKEFIEKQGGKIWVESEEGIGSTFYFTLPYIVESNEKNKTKAIEEIDNSENHVKNLKILIAEDDEASAMLLSLNVSEFSNEILYARTGSESIEVCRNNPDLDLILMDIQMPIMNGYEATRQIRQFNKDVIIIAQTAYGLTGDREKSLDAGCNDYITKPIKLDHLMALIQKYFNK